MCSPRSNRYFTITNKWPQWLFVILTWMTLNPVFVLPNVKIYMKRNVSFWSLRSVNTNGKFYKHVFPFGLGQSRKIPQTLFGAIIRGCKWKFVIGKLLVCLFSLQCRFGASSSTYLLVDWLLVDLSPRRSMPNEGFMPWSLLYVDSTCIYTSKEKPKNGAHRNTPSNLLIIVVWLDAHLWGCTGLPSVALVSSFLAFQFVCTDFYARLHKSI